MRSMKKISLLLLLLLLQQTSATSAVEYPTFPLPSSCPTNCGDLSIEYPFGIGRGCFRPGFELVCDGSTSPPKLLLGHSDMELNRSIAAEAGSVFIKQAIATVSIDVVSSYIPMINLPPDGPYNLHLPDEHRVSYYDGSTGLKLWVTGCSAIATLIDPTHNKILGECASLCQINYTRPKEENFLPEGVGHCRLYFSPYLDDRNNLTKSLAIQVTRLNQSELRQKNDSTIEAFITNNFYDWEQFDGIGGEVEIALGWLINDEPTCGEAKRNQDTYACLSSNSDCVDASTYNASEVGIGYFCQCSWGFKGNPYLPNGCQGTSLTHPSNDNCTRKCGKIEVPFPFGIEAGCYRSDPFALICNRTTDHLPTLLMNSSYFLASVSNILLEEGKLEFEQNDVNIFYIQPDRRSTPFMFLIESSMVSWVIQYQSCEEAKQNAMTYACQSDYSVCLDANITNFGSKHIGYHCKCAKGYEGNPYIPNGCKDINECEHPDKYVCNAICINSIGSFSCTCPEGTDPDPVRGFCTPNKRQTLLLGIIIGVSSGVGILLLVPSVIFCARKLKRRKCEETKRKHFRQNHGLLLQQLLSTSIDTAEKTKIFALKDLEKATNNFDDTRILGRGGHGMVYKGILSDQRIVAIKKSKIVQKKEIDQFINEVVILSHVNHRHVVKLFGCCLETEVPLLIYEFVSNGTLFDHLHNQSESSLLTWDDRLRIATEAASALSYLHSAASISIFHRDVKSQNILLDDYYTVKVSDFGASRSIPHDQTHILTGVQGTFGYLDPEYYQTGQLTEKSDVYSFGVILAELLTGKKPVIYTDHGEQVNLSMQFLKSIKENCVFEILEACVVKEGSEEELNKVILLAESCLQLKGDHRPTMKEVEFRLQHVRKFIRQERYWSDKVRHESQLQPNKYLSNHKSTCINLDNQATQGTSRNYSFENEIMSSLNYPR